MKKPVKLISAVALIGALSAGFVACNEPKGPNQPEEPTEVGVAPVPVAELPEEVTAFFEKYLPAAVSESDPESEIFFVDQDGDKCLMINSSEELKKLVPPSIELPPVDFDNYTLVIGQQVLPTSSYYVIKQAVSVESERVVLNLTVKIPESSYQAFTYMYHWGLFPKFSANTINVNVIKSK